MHVGRDIAICIAVYAKDNPIVVSPAYTTFMVKDELVLLPEFLFLQLSRVEFGRYGWFLCDGSVRGGLDWKRFCDIEIPLPPIDVQQAIVDVYHCMERAKQIASQAREKLKILCPALVQRAAHS
ncbi:MAG: restriction endonuclease subunit S [bacterium]|nr:restriction endonuclease subunit S [bacterium]MDD7723850.1 restriction endonuclease subunit S [bacterium]MDY4103862.1 restriction endonuclease subunit S [Parabacteroides sp.]